MSKSNPSKEDMRRRVRASKPRALVSISLVLSLVVTAEKFSIVISALFFFSLLPCIVALEPLQFASATARPSICRTNFVTS